MLIVAYVAKIRLLPLGGYMLTFNKYATLDLMRFILSTTTDEKTMIRTWRLFRSTIRGHCSPWSAIATSKTSMPT